jgi:glycosyltransferase involved in cell wall biosynthesis
VYKSEIRSGFNLVFVTTEWSQKVVTKRRQSMKVVLSLGRLHPLKGLDLLISAWAEVKKCANAGMRECGNGGEAPRQGEADPRQCANAGMRECGNAFSWQLVIAGPDEQGTKEQLKALSEKLKLTTAETSDLASAADADIVFLGPVHGDAKWALMQRAEIFVLPSRSENFGMVVGEALSCGVPVVTTAVGPWGGAEEVLKFEPASLRATPSQGSSKVLKLGESAKVETETGNWKLETGGEGEERSLARAGLFVVETSVEGIAAGVRRMMALSDAERKEMGRRGCAWVRRDFSWESVAKQMVAAYDNDRLEFRTERR